MNCLCPFFFDAGKILFTEATMTKSRFHRLIAVLCLLLCVVTIFCACKPEDPEPTPTPDSGNTNTNPTYTVTVVDENNQPIEGATVLFYMGNTPKANGTTNASGICSQQLPASLYTVKVAKNDYTTEKELYHFATDATTMTVQMEKKPSTTYVVTVLDENGNPVEGAPVQLCDGEICRPAQYSNANGVATITVDDNRPYTVSIDLTASGYKKVSYQPFPTGETTMIIQLELAEAE